MKYFLILLLSALHLSLAGQDLYTSKNVKVTLFSSALIEDIKAASSSGVSVFNPTTGELDFSISISSFQFDKAFMQQHFNSDYMESDKYPRAVFKGKMHEHVDLSKDGSYLVSASGLFTVHGVSRNRTIQGTVNVKNGVPSLSSEFWVKCADHHIDIPQILFYHIAESIKINVSATYSLYGTVASK